MPSELLRCAIPGCHARIRGMTGLQEAENLLKHLNRVHAAPGERYTMSDALEFRARFEETADVHP